MKIDRTPRCLVVAAAATLLLSFPALAGPTLEKELSLRPGGRLVVDSDSGRVTVTGTSRSNVRAVVTSTGEDIESDFTLQFSEAEGTARIVARRKGAEGRRSWFDFGWRNRKSLTWEIEVPHDTALEIATGGGSISVRSTRGAARLDTSGGSIQASDLEGRLHAETSGGSISVENVGGDASLSTSGGSITARRIRGNLRAETSGGSIRIDEVSGDASAETSGGGIHVADAGGHLVAETSGGPVSASFAAGNSRGGSLRTSGGGISVRLDPTVNLEIDASSSGGSVSTDLSVTTKTTSRSSLRGSLNAGGAKLNLRSQGGSIRIEAL